MLSKQLLSVFVAIQNRIAAVRDQERGATAVEYGLMVALIAVVIIVAVRALGDNLRALFENVANEITP
jgi:pilus assembly protein Flp/PilA